MDLDKIKIMLDKMVTDVEKIKQAIFGDNYQNIASSLNDSNLTNVIEGVFDGEQMIDKDGKEYNVPPNYASKSKLVSGDILKLTIANDGGFIFKQIGPIERKKLIGILKQDSLGNFTVETDLGIFKVLSAAVSYFKAVNNDKLTVIVPSRQPSIWAAVENKLEINDSKGQK